MLAFEELMDDTAEEMEMLEEAERSDSRKHKRKYLNRDRAAGRTRLFNDYFSDDPLYPELMFRRRFRMKREFFLRIVEAPSNHSEYFQMMADTTGKDGLSPLQKCTTAIRQLAYGTPADHYDEYIRIGESTVIKYLLKLCRCVNEVFANEYLRRPNANDVQRLFQLHSDFHGFFGMLGSIDCMHWPRKNCPIALKCQFTRGNQGVPTIMLEAVASQDLWIWHAFFGVAASNNDINVLNKFHLFNDVLQGYSPEVQFTVNGTQYTNGCYLADGIYPEWATMVKSFPHPQDPKRKKFKEMQEATRKDVERAFGVLQSRWAIVRGAARLWHREKLTDIMYPCIILHNMIAENEGNAICSWFDDEVDPPISVARGSPQEFQQYIQRYAQLRDREIHHQLRSDLVEHIWKRFGDYNNLN